MSKIPKLQEGIDSTSRQQIPVIVTLDDTSSDEETESNDEINHLWNTAFGTEDFFEKFGTLEC